MLRFVLHALLLGLLLAGPAASAEPAPPESTQKAGIGLVLGGGGARGGAHIGILKVLERERIPVDHIVGTSMGAVIGGLYAAGYSPEEIESIFRSIDWDDLFDDDPKRAEQPMRRKEDDLRFLTSFELGFRDGKIQLPTGVVQGQKLSLLLRRLLLSTWDVQGFDQLPVPFRCVSTDIVKGEAVVFDRGDLAMAIRSSLSIPAAFAPIRLNDRLLVDGSIVNNVPVDVAREMGAQRLIAVDVGEPLAPEEELNSPISVTLQMLSVLIRQRTKFVLRRMRPEDVLIVPELGTFSAAAFPRTVETIPAGEKAAEASVARLREFSLSPAEYAQWRTRHRRRQFDAPLISFLDVAKRESRTAGYVEHRLSDTVGKKLDVKDLEEKISEGYGRGNYEQVGWNLVKRDGKTGIEVVPVDKSWGPTFLAFGLQLSDDFSGRSGYQLVAESTFADLNSGGGEWRNSLSLGQISGLRSEFYQPFGNVGQFYALPYLAYVAINQPLAAEFSELSSYRVRRVLGGLELGYNLSPKLQLSTGLQRGRDSAELELGDPVMFTRKLDSDFAALSVGVTRDTLDEASFPADGSRFELEHSLYRPMLGAEVRGYQTVASMDQAFSHKAHRLLLGFRVQHTNDTPEILQNSNFLGGFTNLSGFSERELFGDQLLLLRSVYYRRMGENAGRLFSVPAYLGASLEAGNVWDESEDIDFGSLIYGGSLFVGIDTFLGPIFLGYGRADTGDQSLYLNFGSLLRPRL